MWACGRGRALHHHQAARTAQTTEDGNAKTEYKHTAPKQTIGEITNHIKPWAKDTKKGTLFIFKKLVFSPKISFHFF